MSSIAVAGSAGLRRIPPEDDRVRPGPALLIVAGIAALVGAGAIYVSEQSDSSRLFADDPNYAPALLLLGAGAYLILLAVILIAGRR